MKRREFIGALVSAAAATAAQAAVPAASVRADGGIPRRPLGKSGVDLSVIGFSGVVARDSDPTTVARVVGESRERGINFFDTAASYGNSEFMLAPVLKACRKEIVLATKTRLRTAEEAREEFQRSCEILGTDFFDMYLVHSIRHVDRDVDAVFAPGGAMEYLLERKQSGQIRLLGFSAHSTEAALAAMDRYDFDFFYFPVSYVPFYKGDFGPSVLAKAAEKGIPCVSLKALARQRWPEDIPEEARPRKSWYQPIEDPEEASLAMRWALQMPGVTSLLPPGEEKFYRLALAQANNLTPLAPEEEQQLRRRATEMTPLFPR